MAEMNATDYDMNEVNPYAEYFRLVDIHTWITTYIYPFFLLFGTIGNILTFYYMIKLCRNTWSTAVYLAVNSVIELVILYMFCGNDWLAAVTDKNINLALMDQSEIFCRVYPFLIQVLSALMAWTYVSVAVELLITYAYPYKIYTMCTLGRAQAISLLQTVLIIGFNLHYFWTFGIYKIYSNDGQLVSPPTCTWINELAKTFRDKISPIMELAITDFLPGWVIFLLLIAIFIVNVTTVKRRNNTEVKCMLGKYFLDLNTLDDLRSIFLVITAMMALLKIVSSSKYIFFFLADVAIEKKKITKIVMEISLYAFLSLKILLFLAFCPRIRKDFFGRLYRFVRCVERENKSRVYAPPSENTHENNTSSVSITVNNVDTIFADTYNKK